MHHFILNLIVVFFSYSRVCKRLTLCCLMPRERERLNYKIYNATGRKVAKENRELERISEHFRNLAAMANQKSIDKDKKVCLQIDRLIGEYDFDLLFDVGASRLGLQNSKN